MVLENDARLQTKHLKPFRIYLEQRLNKENEAIYMGNLPCFVGIDPGYKTGAVALITENGLRYMTYLFGRWRGQYV